jgi:hypothetical protein
MTDTASQNRAVPVNASAGVRRRIMGATDWWFYPLLLAMAAGLIVLSLGADIFDRGPQPQEATTQDGALAYGPHQIARGARVDPTHVRYVVRDLGVSARAVRFAVRPDTPAPTAGDTGVLLLLRQQETAQLVGRPVRATVTLRRFSITAAAGLALRLDDGAWVTVPLPAQSGPVTVDLPAPGAAPQTLGIRLISAQSDMNYGAEFQRIALASIP